MAADYHYIIVGAGSAGCTLANRLSEDPEIRVLLLEAGPEPDEIAPKLEAAVEDPALFQLLQESPVDWDFHSLPDPGLDHRSIYIPRGRLVGGSSQFMAGMVIRGNKRDYDDWASFGNRGWSYRDVLPYFKKVETNLGTHIDPAYHGFDGPMIVTDLPKQTPAGRAFLEAAMALGHPYNNDFNGPHQVGVGNYQFYLDPDDRRVNSAQSFLTPEVRARQNLTIQTRALATSILFEGSGSRLRAVGLAYEDTRDGARVPKTVEAANEVIVACGTIDSPKLLMLSGIGPREELRRHNIALRKHLPGVGNNLQDHIIAPAVYSYKPGTAPDSVIGYGIEGGLFWRTSRSKQRPDVQFLFNNSLLGPPGEPVEPIAYMLVPTLITPASRGRVRLGGSFVGSKPEIEGNYLTVPEDLEILVEGMKEALRIAEHPAFDGVRGDRIFPMPEKEAGDITDQDLREYIQANAGTLYHPAATCRMGPHPYDRRQPAVVNASLRVHGVQGLRVVDASIMPNVTAGNTHTPTAMIAEKASELIRQSCGERKVKARPVAVRAGASCSARTCRTDGGETPVHGGAVPSAQESSASAQAPATPPATPAPTPQDPPADADAGVSGAAAGTSSLSGPPDAPAPPSAGPQTLAQAFLEILANMGVRYFFGVLGSDAPSIIDAFARRAAQGQEFPAPIQVPHEMVAMSMAHGYYLATGEPQVVMVYDAVGTANATTGMINAARTNIPLVVMSGATSYSENAGPTSRVIEPHWASEPRDQAGILRQFAKWDYTVRTPDELETVTRRAFAVAMSEPKGPVYLKMPIDVMALAPKPLEESTPAKWVATAPLYPDPRVVEEAVNLLASASNPLIITRSFGRDPRAVPDLVALAEALAIPVVEFQIAEAVNFPSDHPLQLGYDPNPFLDQADVILVVDCPVPWVPLFKKPQPTAKVIHVGTDPLYHQIPLWGFQATLALAANSALAVKQMAQAAARCRRGRVHRERFERLKKAHDEQRREWAAQAEEFGKAEVSSPEWVSAVLGRYVDDSTLVVQEYDLKLNQVGFNIPGSYFGFSPAGGLGYGGGAALGAKLANPDKTVISVLGDGTYLLGVPSACHMMSAAFDLPVLWILTNNHGWGAVKLETQLVYPDGWAQRTGNFPLIRFGVEPAYEKFAEAVGGTGESIVRPQDLPAAIERGLEVVRRERRQVLLNVDCGEPSFSV